MPSLLRPAAGELALRRPVWAALAGMFVASTIAIFQTDLSLTRGARVAQLAASAYTLAEIEQILTEEVYPVCWHTLQADAGQGEPFDADWLAAQILGRSPSPEVFDRLIALARITVPRSHEWQVTAAALAARRGVVAGGSENAAP